jgi:hypothetical protein
VESSKASMQGADYREIPIHSRVQRINPHSMLRRKPIEKLLATKKPFPAWIMRSWLLWSQSTKMRNSGQHFAAPLAKDTAAKMNTCCWKFET